MGAATRSHRSAGGVSRAVRGRRPGLVYLDGNSLGRLPRATLERLAGVVAEEWGGRLIRGWWERWLELPRASATSSVSSSARPPAQVIVADSTTVCLYKLASAALDLDPAPDRDRGHAADEFPTDRYVLEGLAAARGLELRWLDADPVDGPSTGDLAAALGPRTALVVLSHVNYRSARDRAARGDHAPRARRRRPRPLGPLPQRRRAAGRARRGRRRPRRRLHLQVPERRARDRRRSSTSGATSRRSSASRSGAGSAAATSS